MITYDDKVTLIDHPEIAEINKITDDNMNEIKSEVNDNITATQSAQSAADNAQGSADTAQSDATTALNAANNAQSDIDTHEALTNNPHAVTASQTGAVPTGRTLTIDGVTYDLSVNRTWATASGFVYYADAYGLVGDSNGTTGNGTDNATALGELVDLVLSNGGGTIRLGKGIYRYTGVLVKTGNNVTIEGDGMGVSTMFCDNTSVNNYALVVNGNNNHYRFFTVQGRKTFQSAGVGLGVYGTNSSAFQVEVKDANCFALFVVGTNIRVSQCVIHDSAADGIHVAYSDHCQIVNNIIHTCADDGIGVGYEGACNNIDVLGNIIYKTSAGVAVMGYSSSGVTPEVYNINVQGNSIQETWLSGILCHITQGSLEGVNITGNTLRNTGGFAPVSTVIMRGTGESYGIGLMSQAANTGFTMKNISITDNNIFTARNCFISVGFLLTGSSHGSLSDIKINDNVLGGTITTGGAGAWGFGAGGDSNTPDDALYPGIAIRKVLANVDVSGNMIRNASANAIRVSSLAVGVVQIKNNLSHNCNVGGGTAYCFDIQGTTTAPVVSGNCVSGTAFSTGVFNIQNGTATVEYNSPQEESITVTGTSHTVVTNNTGRVITMTNSGARGVTMPAASAWIGGKTFWVKDGNGNASSANITMTRAGSDTFEGGGTTNVISTNFGIRGYYHLDGSTVWLTR